MAKNNKGSREIRTRFRELREEYNESHDKQITQKDMAKEYYISEAEISRVERGAKDPQISVLYAYAEKFGVTIEYLLGYSEAKSYENATIGHELGLTDEAVETLKLLKEISGVDMNPISVVNAFLNDKKASYEFFESLFQNIVTEFHHKQTKKSQEEWMYNSGLKKLENAYEIIIRNFVRDVVIPGLKDSIKKACGYNDMLLELQNDPTYYESD